MMPAEEKSSSNHKRHDDVNNTSKSRMEASFNMSLGCLNRSHGDITTSGSNEQWARFRSMGRKGLGGIEPSPNAKTLIKQNVKVFMSIMQKLLALRDHDSEVDLDSSDILLKNWNRSGDIRPGNLLEEVKDTVELKKTRARFKRNPSDIVLPPRVVEQLEDFVTVIAVLYRDNGTATLVFENENQGRNQVLQIQFSLADIFFFLLFSDFLTAFHNFEHASTVLGAVNKVVSLANPPEDIDYTDIRFITTDPWTHFALVFSALIHGKSLVS